MKNIKTRVSVVSLSVFLLSAVVVALVSQWRDDETLFDRSLQFKTAQVWTSSPSIILLAESPTPPTAPSPPVQTALGLGNAPVVAPVTPSLTAMGTRPVPPLTLPPTPPPTMQPTETLMTETEEPPIEESMEPTEEPSEEPTGEPVEPPTMAPMDPPNEPPTEEEVPPTEAPPTEASPTEDPPTEEPPTTMSPTDEPPTMMPPTETPPTGETPTMMPPTDAPPTEEPPTEAPPTGETPTMMPPTDSPPTEEPPTGETPTMMPPTDAPPTEEPPTEAPPTEAPPTEEPPTVGPPTPSPATASPTITPQPTAEPQMCCPRGFTGGRPIKGCTEYYQCTDGVLSPITQSCPGGTLFDEDTGICDFSDQVTCVVDDCIVRPTVSPQPTSPPEPTPQPEPTASPTRQPYICCPEDFTGLRAWANCEEFYRCVDGAVFGDPTACPGDLLFDAIAQTCNQPEAVTDCQVDKCSDQAPTESPVVAPPPTAPPVERLPTISPQPTPNPQMCCPPGFTGTRPFKACTQYYQCVDGNPLPDAISCPEETVFDTNIGGCNFPDQAATCMVDDCLGTAYPTVAPTAAPLTCCPDGFTGLRAFSNCQEFYTCNEGVVVGPPTPCGAGVLFDITTGQCNFEDLVQTCEVDDCLDDTVGDSNVNETPDDDNDVPRPPSLRSPTPPPTGAPVRPPTPPPPPTTPLINSGGLVQEDNRMIAYLGNWQRCPTADQLAQYSHIMIAFAVSYTWNDQKNVCDEQCNIATPPICANSANNNLLADLKAAGKKVILSFGGAGMGGSWPGDVNDCWDYCFGREEQVVDRLVEIVNELDLDGVDIDYEYYYANDQNDNRPFDKGAEAQYFLREVTLGLRQKLPTNALVTHAPMDPDMIEGTAYFNLLRDISHSLDFLMPQYYNGVTRAVDDGFYGSGLGNVSASEHYGTIVNDFFGGDATRLVMGFCISDCSFTESNANSQEAAFVMEEIAQTYDCHGGAFFWVVEHDADGLWSSGVNKVMESSRGCSGAPISINPQPTGVPTISPAPTTTPAPTAQPTPEPKICCPPGYTGFRAFKDCTEYYQCQNGETAHESVKCGEGLLFDATVNVCNFADQVTSCVVDDCSGDQGSDPTAGSQLDLCCPDDYTGFRPLGDDCKVFYQCSQGIAVGNPITCEGSLLFDIVAQTCNLPEMVNTCQVESC